MTIIIPSYQHREPLRRLLETLRRQLDAYPQLSRGIDIIVVIDGSMDDSHDMAATFHSFPVPLKIVWQPHRGPGAARNTGLALARGEIVLFLDDDMVPGDGLLVRHRCAHRPEREHVLQGPCLVPENVPSIPEARAFYDGLHEHLSRQGRVRQYRQFSPANTSGPAALFRRVGGFDERFFGYGLEDWELCIRLLRQGIAIEYASDAVAWHVQQLSVRLLCEERRCEGRNLVRMVELHPDLVDELCAPAGQTPSKHPRLRGFILGLLRSFRARSPKFYGAFAATSAVAAAFDGIILRRRSRRLLYLALFAANLAGLAEADTSGYLLRRRLGLR